MVQSIGHRADASSLFALAGGGRTAAASADGVASLAPATSSAASAVSPVPDSGRTSSGDFASAFQQLSSNLQALMVQLQSVSPAAGTTGADTGTQTVAGRAAMAESAQLDSLTQRFPGGNRALEGDPNALVNDMHGYIQVASGEASLDGPYGGDAATSAGGLTGANDNLVSATAASNATSSPAVSDQAAAGARRDMTYGMAQAVYQATQSYTAAGAPTGAQRNPAVSAVG